MDRQTPIIEGIIFWNVDTQYDFMRPEGALYVKDAEQIEHNLEYLTDVAEGLGIKVVNTADWHTSSSPELSKTPDYKTTFPLHCLQGTRGAQYIRATRPEDPCIISWQHKGYLEQDVLTSREIVLYKDRFDAFDPDGAPFTDEIVRLLHPERAVVYGVATNVCVDFAVKGLLQRGIKVYVPTDAIKELPNLPLEEVLQDWQRLGAQLIKTYDVNQYLWKEWQI